MALAELQVAFPAAAQVRNNVMVGGSGRIKSMKHVAAGKYAFILDQSIADSATPQVQIRQTGGALPAGPLPTALVLSTNAASATNPNPAGASDGTVWYVAFYAPGGGFVDADFDLIAVMPQEGFPTVPGPTI